MGPLVAVSEGYPDTESAAYAEIVMPDETAFTAP